MLEIQWDVDARGAFSYNVSRCATEPIAALASRARNWQSRKSKGEPRFAAIRPRLREWCCALQSRGKPVQNPPAESTRCVKATVVTSNMLTFHAVTTSRCEGLRKGCSPPNTSAVSCLSFGGELSGRYW